MEEKTIAGVEFLKAGAVSAVVLRAKVKDCAQIKPGSAEKDQAGEDQSDVHLTQMHCNKSVCITLMLLLGKLTACQ